MACSIVMYFDRPFHDLEPRLGLVKAAEVRAQSTQITDDIVILVMSGFDNIDDSSMSRLKELGYRVVDASDILSSIRREYSYARETSIWRENPYHEACFLRWLILEKYFDGDPLLAADADIVWRVDPYALLKEWKKGGSFLCAKSPCLTFIRDAEWYRGYREGLERLLVRAEPWSDGSPGSAAKPQDDQALCQWLVQNGIIVNDLKNFRGHSFGGKYLMAANPLSIGDLMGNGLSFQRVGYEDRIEGRIIPFWHMQTAFARYLSKALIVYHATGGRKLRISDERAGQRDLSSFGAILLDLLHRRIQEGHIGFSTSSLPGGVALTDRSYVYDEFFWGGLARYVFSDEVWWREGVWRPPG